MDRGPGREASGPRSSGRAGRTWRPGRDPTAGLPQRVGQGDQHLRLLRGDGLPGLRVDLLDERVELLAAHGEALGRGGRRELLDQTSGDLGVTAEDGDERTQPEEG